MATRYNINDFALANPIYVGGTVSFYTVSGGAKTTTLATLYAASTGSTTLANPRTLDSDGKFSVPVYVEVPTIATVSGLTIADHDTGIMGLAEGAASTSAAAAAVSAAAAFVSQSAAGASAAAALVSENNAAATLAGAAASGANTDITSLAGITLTQNVALSGDISPTQITANQNDYNPASLSTTSVMRLTSDASRDITGLQGGADGRLIVIHNVGSFSIVLKDESGSSTAANRFALAADITLATDQSVVLQYDSTSSRWRAVSQPSSASTSSVTTPPSVRQTVLSGPVDTSGLSSFGGSTGSTTVTASGTLVATCAAGGNDNRTGSITNPSWTGLSTNGTMFLYLDITSGGVVTTGSTTLAPVYQWGGTYSTTNLQNTFNIQEMTMKVGNGSTASQVYRVFAGEVTVAGGVVTAITWYALMGRYKSTLYGLATSTNYSNNHNIGSTLISLAVNIVCQTAELGYSIGDKTSIHGADYDNVSNAGCVVANAGRNSAVTTTTTTTPGVINRSTFVTALITAANWQFELIAQRSW